MKNGDFIKQIEWLIGIALVTFCIQILIFDMAFFTKDSIDIPLHDVYLTISPWKLFLSFLLIIALCVFWLKELIARFQNYWGNWVLITLHILLILLFKKLDTLWNVCEAFFGITIIDEGGWTIYPPLSALPQETDNTVYYSIMAVLLLSLVIVGVKQRMILVIKRANS